ncbi:hypothetical protein [Sphingopyxis sp. MWB1]|uniref:hypothetical protein n=1 Tax=Sphingopyxis sp. MWB1 TaxID=1537715 RepID=UPI00068CE02F|nr:hypothetical protein [Sphingopyxis sp. MWB1]
MRKFAALITTLSLGTAALSAAPALAQDAAATAETKLAVGTKVFDSEKAELGTISAVQGANVVVDLGAGKQVTVPGNAFGMLEQGPTIGATKAQVLAAVDQAAAANDAKLNSVLVVGADVLSAQGAAVIGQVKLVEADGAVLTTPQGDIKLPRNALFVNAQGALATSFTADQFNEAMAQASQAAAADDAAVAAALTAGAEIRDINGTAVLGTVKSFDAANVVVATSEGDVSLPRSAFDMNGNTLAAAYTVEQFAEAVTQATGSTPDIAEVAVEGEVVAD